MDARFVSNPCAPSFAPAKGGDFATKIGAAPPEITRHTMQSNFRPISLKTKEGDPHKVSHFFMTGLPVSSAKMEGGRVWEIVLRAPRALPGGAASRQPEIVRADRDTSGNRYALRAFTSHKSLRTNHESLGFLIDTKPGDQFPPDHHLSRWSTRASFRRHHSLITNHKSRITSRERPHHPPEAISSRPARVI